MRPKTMHTIRALALAAAGCIALATAGCNIVTPVAYAIAGPGKVKAEFKLAPERRTVIFVDDPSSKVTQRRLRDVIARTATQVLLDKKLVNEAIDPRAALIVAANERHGEQLTLVEIGEAVDAEVLIYVAMTEFTLGEDLGNYLPLARANVKVFDVAARERIWPDDPAGQPVQSGIPQRPGAVPQSPGERLEAESVLAEKFGLAVAQMFYTVEIRDSARR